MIDFRFRIACVLGLVCLIWAGPGTASVPLRVETETFPVSGRTGTELVQSLKLQGPRLGLFKRSPGKATEKIDTSISYRKAGRECRVAKASSRVVLTYALPRASGKLEPSVRRQWDDFAADVKKVLQRHVAVALAHGDEIDGSLPGIGFENDPACQRTAAEIRRRTDRLKVAYRKRHEALEKENAPELSRLLEELGRPQAGVNVDTKTATYPIVGRTGADLLVQMDRKGPKHGFLTRAIAQTRYAVKWNIIWKSDGRDCRVQDATANVDLTYTYPRVASDLSPALRRKWNAFLRGVRQHEEMHGTIARRMVTAAEKAVSSVRVKRDPNCHAARIEAKRRVAAAYAKYEAQQRAFDEREHRDDGNVAALVERLVR